MVYIVMNISMDVKEREKAKWRGLHAYHDQPLTLSALPGDRARQLPTIKRPTSLTMTPR